MSYKYGLNGNDLRWDYMPHDYKCCDCRGDSDYCDGHTHKYSDRGWAVYHDTNGNFVSAVGSVPFEVYETDYLEDWASDPYITPSQRSRIRKELRNRGVLLEVSA
ncbi:hypothetical protein [Paenibacillus hexagrammi]|uniref:Uncharacterized protein n=1 Tax=Paenibacillus hexagrammi TaxID=2908839 RepID=A0ABY3SRJ3_9BACL|nr:hypothetical protein [Paenibacillus sp. YPD9-1]UJF36551.1 hypothetical protein L0M14_30655 [Paenibacillus sp. YPD9-1]